MKNEIQEVMRKEALEVAKEKCIVISCLDGTAFCERDAMPAGTPVVADSLAHLSDDDVIKGWGSLMDARAKVVAAHDMPTAWGKRIPYCRAEVIWIYGILCERIHPQKAAKLLVRAIRKADEDRGKPHFQDMYGDQWRMLRRIARAKDNKEIFHLMNPDVSGLGEAQNVTTTDGETMTMYSAAPKDAMSGNWGDFDMSTPQGRQQAISHIHEQIPRGPEPGEALMIDTESNQSFYLPISKIPAVITEEMRANLRNIERRGFEPYVLMHNGTAMTGGMSR